MPALQYADGEETGLAHKYGECALQEGDRAPQLTVWSLDQKEVQLLDAGRGAAGPGRPLVLDFGSFS